MFLRKRVRPEVQSLHTEAAADKIGNLSHARLGTSTLSGPWSKGRMRRLSPANSSVVGASAGPACSLREVPAERNRHSVAHAHIHCDLCRKMWDNEFPAMMMSVQLRHKKVMLVLTGISYSVDLESTGSQF